MNGTVLMVVVVLSISSGYGYNGINQGAQGAEYVNKIDQDTMLSRQLLYNGIVWKNKYHSIDGDQFYMTDWFLPGEVSINGQTFENQKIKFDIYNDELLVPINRDEIVQLNKEMVDSFTMTFENRSYKFINLRNEGSNGFTGYVNILYKGKSELYVKARKEISHYITEKKLGSFYENDLIYLMKDNIAYKITTKKNLYKILQDDNSQLRSFVSHNKIRLSKKRPESYVPLIRYYDSLSH